MYSSEKPQRIRDSLHNLIEFGSDSIAQTLWKVVQTHEFQRLRRIKQLGFSEVVYPGATHTRFSHSLGVYHIAKKLLHIVKQNFGDSFNTVSGQIALTAALVHDVGHGPFSHAFETVGKRLNLKKINHEDVSCEIIQKTDIGRILDEENESGFSTNVAKLIAGHGPSHVYRAIVSSQFDADRLDYMQRDRLMAGTQLAAIDFSWLLANLEVGEVPWGEDENPGGTIDTFVLGPKAIHAAEAYILSLFQLYPTVYFHKTTRGAEKLFTELLVRVFQLVHDDSVAKINLPDNHALVQFMREPDCLERQLALDDVVVMGALSLMKDAEDVFIKEFSERLYCRKFYKCIDVMERLKQFPPMEIQGYTSGKLPKPLDSIEEEINGWPQLYGANGIPRILQDHGSRSPYKKLDQTKGKEVPINQIMIKQNGKIVDIQKSSPIIGAIPTFVFYRVYVRENDQDARHFIDNIIRKVVGEN